MTRAACNHQPTNGICCLTMKPDELPQTPPLDGPLLTIADVADRLGVSRVTASRYIADGRIAAVRLGDADTSPIRIPARALTQFLAEARERQSTRLKETR